MKVKLFVISLVFIVFYFSNGQDVRNVNKEFPAIKKYISSTQNNILMDTFNFFNISNKTFYSIKDSILLKEFNNLIVGYDSDYSLPELYYCGRIINVSPKFFDMYVFLEIRRYEFIVPFTSHCYLINIDRNSSRVLSFLELFINDHITTDYKMIRYLESYLSINPYEPEKLRFKYHYKEEADNQVGFELKEVEYIINQNGFLIKNK